MKTSLSRKPTDYVSGVNSPIPFTVNLTSGDWRYYVSDSQEQLLKYDTNACSQLSPAKTAMEGQLNFLYQRDMLSADALSFFTTNGYIVNGYFYISHQFNAILDGTSINGNNPYNTAVSYKNDGIIPRLMLNMTVLQSEQYNSQTEQDAAFYAQSNITPSMIALGKQSLQYIQIAYQWINDDNGQSSPLSILSNVIRQAPLIYGIPIPADVSNYNETLVKWDGGKSLEHCVGGTFVDSTPNAPFPIYIEDNYIPFQKQLSSDYWISQVLQIVVTPVSVPMLSPVLSLTVWQKFVKILISLSIVKTQGMTFDPKGQYTAAIAFIVGLINQYAPFLGVTVQGTVQIISAILVLWGIYKSYKAHKALAVSVGVPVK